MPLDIDYLLLDVLGSDPTTPAQGSVWYNSTTNKLRVQGTNSTLDLNSTLNNYVATTNPLVTSDSSAGYSVGSVWINLTTGVVYTCCDSTASAAVWKAASSSFSNGGEAGGANRIIGNTDNFAFSIYTNNTERIRVDATGLTNILNGLSMNSLGISNVLDPVNPQDAVTKTYAESILLHPQCRVATTANITLSGTQTIDAVAVVAGDRVLVKNQTTGSQNGIYVVAAGAWARATDFSTSVQANRGGLIFILAGTVGATTVWVLTTTAVTLGTTALVFAILGVSATVPTSLGAGAGATGTSNFYSRIDHTHSVTTGTPVALTLAGANTVGVATTLARSDHLHALPAVGTPVALTLGAANAAGSAVTIVRSDHVHALPAVGTPVALTVGGANAAGVAVTLTASDHTHALPAFGTTAGTFAQGNDSRLSDDRTASGLRTASGIVVVSAAAAPAVGQVLTATSSTTATWQGGGSGGLFTFPVSLINNTSIDIYSNTPTWGGLVIATANMTINSLVAWVYQQGGAGNIWGGIYDATSKALIATTVTADASTVGLKTMAFSSGVSLTKGTAYYLAITSTANGVRVAGNSNAAATFNLSPKPSFNQLNSQMPATLTPSVSGNLVWIQANT